MRVLIVEDDVALASIIQRYLQPVSSSIKVAYNMADAMREIAATPPVELVTLDLALPDSTAQETLARIKEMKAANPNCLLMVVTGAMKSEQEDEALSLGADGFLHKTTVMRTSGSFMQTLWDILRSIKRVPERYQKNLPILEKLTERICQYVTSCNIEAPNPQT